jgi:hypothetical protein
MGFPYRHLYCIIKECWRLFGTKIIYNTTLTAKRACEKNLMTAKTKNQENPKNESRLFNSEERAIFSEVAATDPPYSLRAQALLAIDEGSTQSEASRQAGLTIGQLRYWLRKFRRDGTSIFPEELLIQTEPEEADEEDARQEMPVAEEPARPVDKAAVQKEDASVSKKKSKKKTKKSKKQKKAKKGKKKKGKKSAKKSKKKSKK